MKPKIKIGHLLELPTKDLCVPKPGPGMMCPWCGEQKVGEPHSFVALNGGGMLRQEGDDAVISQDIAGFCILLFHGAHPEDGGSGAHPDKSAIVDIADGTPFGQFELYFCSTACTRAFFNGLVDELERQLKEQSD
jgi:hypothetical protein